MGFRLMASFIDTFDAAHGYVVVRMHTQTHTSVHSRIFTAIAW
jgi:hypothetical protein